MSKIAVTFDILKQYDDSEEELNWTTGEIKTARKLLNSNYNKLTLPESMAGRHIQTIWGQVELLEGDRRVDFLVFTPKRIYVIEVKDHKSLDNFAMPWENHEKSAWKQCSQYIQTIQREVEDLIEIVGIVFFPELSISDDLLSKINDYAIKHFSVHSYFSKELNKMSFNRILEDINSRLPDNTKNYKNMLCAMKKIVPDIFVREDLDCTSDIPLLVFEEEQARVAKNIGMDGDRIIYGVAGSGKTLMLVTKALQLNELYRGEKKILVVCHNKPLRRYFETKLHHTSIEVRTVYSWYNSLIRSWGSSELESYLSDDEKELGVYDQMPLMIQYGLEHGKLLPKYDCILIDEGQDIASNSFKHLKLAHVNSKKNNLFMVFLDNLQSIHKRDEDSFRWVDVGINALGRTRYFRKNYRNAKKVAEYALQVVQDKLGENGNSEENEELNDILVDTDQIARGGGTVHSLNWKRSDLNYNLAGEIIKQQESHTIMIVYSKLRGPLKLLNINEALPKLNNNRRIVDCSENEMMPSLIEIPLYSVYRCKGLEADVVFYIHTGNEEPEISFVGNTRAREILYDINTTWK